MTASLILANSWVFFFSYNPFILALVLSVIAILLSVFLATSCCKWVGLSLALVFAGGMMVSFLYIASLSFNLKFIVSPPNALLLLAPPVLSLHASCTGKAPASLIPPSFFLSWNSLLIMVLVCFLLTALLIVVKLSETLKGSLVKKF